MTTHRSPLDAFAALRADVAPLPPAAAGLARCHVLSDALDAALAGLFAAIDDRFALLAIGGYGRREQCRHSDIDLAILVPRRAGSAHRERVARALYPLWDAGLKVGYSVRTVKETAEAAAENVETLTALLDVRLIAGDAGLHEDFLAERQRFVRRLRAGLTQELAVRREALIAREPWQIQAANVKTGRGGLRDLQAVRWLDAADAIADGRPVPPVPAALERPLDRLLATRQAIHAQVARPLDVYRDDVVPRVARWLGVEVADWSRELALAMRAVDAAVAERLGESATRSARTATLLRWFRRADDHPDPGESDLDRLLAALERLTAVDEPPVPLEPMPRTEWLRRILPEWQVLRARRHIAPFHAHPVDVHVVRTVAEAARLGRVADPETGADEAVARLPDRRELLLAALLHDIGKGHEAEHVDAGRVIAERFATRAALPPATAQRLVRAVELHLVLPAVATRRDIADPRVVAETAARVGDASTLHLVYALAIADARATGGDVWNAWKGQLLRTLYLRVLAALGGAAPGAATEPEERLRLAVEVLSDRFPAHEVEAHVRGVGPRYLLGTSPEAIGDHIAMAREALGTPDGTAVRHDRAGDVDRVTVVTRDRPGLIQAVAGTLAAHNADVLGGIAYTRDDGVAIEVWHVVDALDVGIDERRRARILDAIPGAIDGRWPVEQRVAEHRRAYAQHFARARRDLPTRVQIDNAASADSSVIEVSTGDRPGLLYAITRCLHESGIDIHLAKVDTVGPEVVDAFYVTRAHGRRIEAPDEIERVRRLVREAILALDALADAASPAGGG